MQKRIFGKKLSRSRTARDALVRSQIRALVKSGKIVTTQAKAKMLRSYVEKLFALAGEDAVAVRRRVYARLANDGQTTKRIFDLVGKSGKKYGFCKLVALPPRRGDMAKMARIEIIDWFEAKGKETEKKDTKTKEKITVKKKKD
jgi:large subunit ribosomal protein L17